MRVHQSVFHPGDLEKIEQQTFSDSFAQMLGSVLREKDQSKIRGMISGIEYILQIALTRVEGS